MSNEPKGKWQIAVFNFGKFNISNTLSRVFASSVVLATVGAFLFQVDQKYPILPQREVAAVQSAPIFSLHHFRRNITGNEIFISAQNITEPLTTGYSCFGATMGLASIVPLEEGMIRVILSADFKANVFTLLLTDGEIMYRVRVDLIGQYAHYLGSLKGDVMCSDF